MVLSTYHCPIRSFGRRGGGGQIPFHARHAIAASDGGTVSCSSFPRDRGENSVFRPSANCVAQIQLDTLLKRVRHSRVFVAGIQVIDGSN